MVAQILIAFTNIIMSVWLFLTVRDPIAITITAETVALSLSLTPYKLKINTNSFPEFN